VANRLVVMWVEHFSSLPLYVDKFTVKRGQPAKVTFTASRAGIFPLVFVNHQPTMTGYPVVLPKQRSAGWAAPRGSPPAAESDAEDRR